MEGLETCPLHSTHDTAITENRKAIKYMEEKTNELGKNQALIEQNFSLTMKSVSDSLLKLSKSMDNLEKTNGSIQQTMIKMQAEIQTANDNAKEMKEQVQNLSDKVDKMDSDDKISIRAFFKEHILALVVTVGIASATGMYLLSQWIPTIGF